MLKKPLPLGAVYGRLTVVGHTATRVICNCACGEKEILRRRGHLVSGSIKSCGCARSERAKTLRVIHGMSYSSEYNIWEHIVSRCCNPENNSFHHYGGRGISICERWKKFENFYEDMGQRPSPGHSIDRMDNNGNYEPTNCRWATHADQMSNTRRSRKFSFRGEVMVITAASRKFGINVNTLWHRLTKQGMSPEDAITIVPIRGRRK